MNSPSAVSFHDSILNSIITDDDKICMLLESVYSNGQLRDARVCFKDVSAVISGGNSLEGLRMEGDDGEVLTLEKNEKGIQLIVQWANYRGRKTWTRSYLVVCQEMTVQIG